MRGHLAWEMLVGGCGVFLCIYGALRDEWLVYAVGLALYVGATVRLWTGLWLEGLRLPRRFQCRAVSQAVLEHSAVMREAYEAATVLRKRVMRLHWIAGGRGYDNMGRRELEQARIRADETIFWLAAASRSLAAGAARAVSLGYQGKKEQSAQDRAVVKAGMDADDERVRHHGTLKGHPPYVGGDDDETDVWQAECGCGYLGRKTPYLSVAYGELVEHLNDVLRT